MWVCRNKKCRAENPNNNEYCWKCGSSRVDDSKKTKLLVAIIASCAVVIVVMGLWIAKLLFEDKPAPAENTSPVFAVSPTPTVIPTSTPTPKAEDLRVMFFTTEITNDLTVWVDDPIDLTVQVIPLTIQGLHVDWKSSDSTILTIEKTGEYSARIECHDNGNLPKACKLTLTCNGFQKELTIYCRPLKDNSVSYPEKTNATYWSLVNGTLTINGEGRMPDYSSEVAPWRIDDEEGTNIKNISVESGVTSIGSQAFQYCFYAKNAFLPDTISSIGYAAFYRCGDLQEVRMPYKLQELGASSFDHCEALKHIIVPDGINTIKNATFNCCSSMEWVYIPKTVTSIEDSAFNGCWALKTVYYGGSISDWNKIQIASYNRPLKAVSVQFESQVP